MNICTLKNYDLSLYPILKYTVFWASTSVKTIIMIRIVPESITLKSSILSPVNIPSTFLPGSINQSPVSRLLHFLEVQVSEIIHEEPFFYLACSSLIFLDLLISRSNALWQLIPSNGYSCYFQFMAIITNFVVNTSVLVCVDICFHFSCGKHMTRNWKLFHSGCTILHCHQQSRCSVPLMPMSDFLSINVLVGIM